MGGSQANIELWALPAAVPDLASLGQYRLSEIVAPAYADADIAKIGRASEIARRCLVSMVRLHHCWKRLMCASNNEFGTFCLPVTGSRRREAA